MSLLKKRKKGVPVFDQLGTVETANEEATKKKD